MATIISDQTCEYFWELLTDPRANENNSEQIRKFVTKCPGLLQTREIRILDGRTPLQYVASEGKISALEVLVEHLDDSNSLNDALRSACGNSQIIAAKILIQKGADAKQLLEELTGDDKKNSLEATISTLREAIGPKENCSII